MVQPSQTSLLRTGAESAAAALDRLGFLKLRFQRAGAVRVLCYHGVCADALADAPWTPAYFVSASQFASHLAVAAQFGPFAFLPDVIESLARGEEVPAGVAITFDDVAACTFEHARPVLNKHGIRASFFISSGFATSGRLFAADVVRLLQAYPAWAPHAADVGLAELLAAPEAHKRMPTARLRELLEHAEAAVRARAAPEIVNALRCLNWAEIRSLADDGHEIGGHTADHAILGVESAEVRRAQIEHCLDTIARELGRRPVGFAYPNGGPGDFDASDAAILRHAGVRYAVSTRCGAIEPGADVFNWPRVCVGRRHTGAKVALELSGLLDTRRRRQQGWAADRVKIPRTGDTAPSMSDVADPAGMRAEEYARLEELLAAQRPRRTLEIGMASGGSALRICRHLQAQGGERHTAVDPFQSDPAGWDGQGIRRVAQAGLAAYLEVIEAPDYLALPKLLDAGAAFDFVLIDGWHSFDHTLLDVFYADLLLTPGGVLAIHDTGWPAVYKACRFLETHKAYTRIGPPISVIRTSLAARLTRRVGQVLRGPKAMADARARRASWFALAAYRKEASRQVPNDFYAPF